MGSKASTHARLPIAPRAVDAAYLAALLDRGGFLAGRTIGLKVEGPEELVRWLRRTFGGTISGNCWLLTRQADLRILLLHVVPHMRVRAPQARALEALLDHCATRSRYHGDEKWRAERARLAERVRAAGRAAVLRATV